MYKICIDAGHGGYDTGNILGGLQEKSLSLGVAQALNSLLTKDGNFEVVMTRSGDYSAGHYENQVARELSERARISNEYEADLFLSIHFSTDGQASDFVNDTTGKGVPDLIVGSLKSTLGAFGEFDETDQYIVVARETKAPSVILSIPIAQQWATPDGQKTLASDLYNAICQGFGVQAKTDIASTPVQAPVVQAPTVTTLDTTNPPQGGSAIVTAPATSNSVADKLTTDTPATPVQSTPVVASASGVTLVTHSELSNLLAEFSKTAEVSAGLSGVEQYVRDVESKLSGYVKTSDIEQIVLNVLLKALTKTNQ